MGKVLRQSATDVCGMESTCVPHLNLSDQPAPPAVFPSRGPCFIESGRATGRESQATLLPLRQGRPQPKPWHVESVSIPDPGQSTVAVERAQLPAHLLYPDRVRGDLGRPNHPYVTYYGHTYEERACHRSYPGVAYVGQQNGCRPYVESTHDEHNVLYTKPMQGFSAALVARYNQVHKKYDDVWKQKLENGEWSKYPLMQNGPFH